MGGRDEKPTDPTDPGDPAYDWALYDRLVRYATQNDIQVVFSILFTRVGQRREGAHRRADQLQALHDFAYAAA